LKEFMIVLEVLEGVEAILLKEESGSLGDGNTRRNVHLISCQSDSDKIQEAGKRPRKR